MRFARFAVARAPLELLPPSVLRHPEELASNQLGTGKERKRKRSGTDALPKLLGFFFFWVPLSLGRASYGTAQARLIYFQAL